MYSASIHFVVVARSSGEAAMDYRIDNLVGSSDFLAMQRCLSSGSTMMHGIQNLKNRVCWTDCGMKDLAKIEERCNSGSSLLHSQA